MLYTFQIFFKFNYLDYSNCILFQHSIFFFIRYNNFCIEKYIIHWQTRDSSNKIKSIFLSLFFFFIEYIYSLIKYIHSSVFFLFISFCSSNRPTDNSNSITMSIVSFFFFFVNESLSQKLFQSEFSYVPSSRNFRHICSLKVKGRS